MTEKANAEARELRTNLLWQAGRLNDMVCRLATTKANREPGQLGRALSVAVTEMETAVLWIRRAAELIEVEPASPNLPPVGEASVLKSETGPEQYEMKFPEGKE